jgi:undecaprenyl diphosphate synthase
MKQSALHVAISPDGNGRWAGMRGRSRSDGHRAGAQAVRRVVEGAPQLGITVLTLYAFSSDNWHRPAAEVGTLMRLFERYLRGETARCVAEGVRVRVIGRRDRLARRLVRAIEATEGATSGCRRLRLNLAVDYSSRHAIQMGDRLRDVDLLIRTGGEQRLSDFLLWESAYAELYFTKRQWPDFSVRDLEAALVAFRGRERRFGRISGTSVGTATPRPAGSPVLDRTSAAGRSREQSGQGDVPKDGLLGGGAA